MMSLFTIGFICAVVGIVAALICCILVSYDMERLMKEPPVQEPFTEAEQYIFDSSPMFPPQPEPPNERAIALTERMTRDMERMKTDPDYSPLKDPLEDHIIEQKEFIKNNRKYISVGIHFPSLLEKLKAENEVLQGKLNDALTLAAQLLDVITYADGRLTADELEDFGQELRHIKCRKGEG